MLNLLRSRYGARNNERGAVVVEFALTLTVFMILLFGAVETGRAVATSHSLSESARAGARTAAALPRIEDYHLAAADAVSSALINGGGNPDPVRMVIYDADPVTGDPKFGDIDNCTRCYNFDWNPATNRFEVVAGPTWDYTQQRACGDVDDTDFLGVWVYARFDLVTTVAEINTDLTGRSIMRLEPVLGEASCLP